MSFPSFLSPTHRPGGLGLPPVMFFDDFLGSEAWHLLVNDVPSHWRAVEVGAGSEVAELDDVVGGQLSMKPGTGFLGRSIILRTRREEFKMTRGARMTFVARFKINWTGTSLWMGMNVTTGNPFDSLPADAMAFTTADAGASASSSPLLQGLQTLVRGGSSGAKKDSAVKITRDRFHEVAIEYDGANTVEFFLDGQPIRKSQEVDKFPFGVSISPHLGIEFESGPTDGSITPDLHIDYVGVTTERPLE